MSGRERRAFADQPRPWETTFQPAATGMMEQITWFEHYTLWFIVADHLPGAGPARLVHLQVPRQRQPAPSRTSHNTLIEVIWTVGPVVVLLFLAVPSFQLLNRAIQSAGRSRS